MSPRRLSRISLRVADVDPERAPSQPVAVRWWMAAAGGAVAIALAGWLLVSGLVVAGWATAMDGSLDAAVGIGTQLWLLVHGAGATIAGTRITLTPLLLSLIVSALLAGVGAYSARLAHAELGAEVRSRGLIVARVVGAVTAAYVAVVMLVVIAAGDTGSFGRALLGSALISALGAYAGAAGVLRWRPWRSWPTRARGLLAGAATGVGVVAAFGLLAGVVAIAQHGARIAQLTHGLGPGPIAGVLLTLLQLAFAPNLWLWAMAYVLGGGFRIGGASVVALTHVQLGLLPAIPILGALPGNGPARGALLAWLLSGIVGGAAAGVVAAWGLRGRRADEPALLGALAGVASGALIALLCALSGGGLGTGELAVLGPRLAEVFVFGCSTLGLSGMLAGLVLGLLREPPREAIAWTHERGRAAGSWMARGRKRLTRARESRSGRGTQPESSAERDDAPSADDVAAHHDVHASEDRGDAAGSGATAARRDDGPGGGRDR